MKILLPFAALFIVSPPTYGQSGKAEFGNFLSWYNGWGTHTVWGAGIIQSPYFGAKVKCGDKMVNVIPIYDTHTNKNPPKENQTQAYAEKVNKAILEQFKKDGIACSFNAEVKNGA